MFQIAPTTRLRRSAFFESTVAEGVVGFSTYNRMLLPIGYGDPEAEYWRLIDGVSQWDVAAQRQVQLAGPDASRLAQILCPRDLSRMVPGQGKYVALCDHAGTVLNDPIILKLDENRFWLSIADSDMLFWVRAIAAERRLDVSVVEPDASPMAVQGPKAEEVIASIFGDWVRGLRYFWFQEAQVAGIPLLVARSGWSKQGGYELYLLDQTKGTALWNLVREAGAPFGIGPGAPNGCERVESGLLSWGGDTDDATNPFEIRMEKFVDLGVNDNVVGIEALRRIAIEGPARHQLGVILDEGAPDDQHDGWHDITVDGAKVGDMTNGVWSRRLGKTIGFGLVSRQVGVGDRVRVIRNGRVIEASLVDLPFI
jgi:glycine cleavage system aminomethyltransferase T